MRVWWALGAGTYLAFVMALFPAAAALRWFAPEPLRVAGVSGTVWSGRAAFASIGDLPLSAIEWRIDGPALLLGRLSGGLSGRLGDGFFNTAASASFGSLRLRDLEVATSLATLDALLPLGGVRGRLSAEIAELELRDGWPTAVDGTVRLQGLEMPPLNSAAAPGLVEIGSFELAAFALDDLGIKAELRDLGGPLEARGTVALALSSPGSLRGATPLFDGQVRERAGAAPELVEPLGFLTLAVDTEGWRTLDLNSWLPTL